VLLDNVALQVALEVTVIVWATDEPDSFEANDWVAVGETVHVVVA
jgi:hypothetical protein